MSDLCSISACELAHRLRRKAVSAREVVEAHLAQIDRVNPRVNAIVTLIPEHAFEQADRADELAVRGEFLGPLHGLPVVHKDLHDTRGIRTTYGSPIFRDHVPDTDAAIVERSRQAGAIMLGKTNTAEFGAGSQTFNPVFGPTRNPFDLSKTCGGSSGGSAVALACGMTPLADGTDTGGSLRNPASFCSVVGFRPSPGRVPHIPAASAWSTLTVAGPMARTVEDATLFLSALAGPDPRSPVSIHETGWRFAQPLEREFKNVRVAWCSTLGGLPFDHRVREIFDKQRRIFEALGCIVEDAEPDFSGADEAFKVFRALEFYQQHADKFQERRSEIKENVIEEVERGAQLTGPQIAAADMKRSHLFARVGEFMRQYEFLVLPVAQVPPFDINESYVTQIDGFRLENYIDWMRSCYYVSVIGHPAISVPAGFTRDSLPVGLQIVGRHQDDRGVLQFAYAYEQENQWAKRFPAVAMA